VADFLRLEIPVDAHGDVDEALIAANRLADQFGITAADVLPWSYGELVAMYRSARHYRTLFGNAPNQGELVLLDGASGSGKTTIFRTLTDGPGSALTRVPRYSTRDPRGDGEHTEYVFVSEDAFAEARDEGAFVESRDFLFGMSYGLPWREAFDPPLAGRDAVGIIDYGNAGHVRRILPEARLVLVEASADTLRKRLTQRGTNTEEQIDERLTNAVALASKPDTYDLIVRNEDGGLDAAVTAIRELLGRPARP
jgi:guanylate kinase